MKAEVVRMAHEYELRKVGDPGIGVRSSVERCGYSLEKLSQIVKAGYRYYVDGKMVSVRLMVEGMKAK